MMISFFGKAEVAGQLKNTFPCFPRSEAWPRDECVQGDMQRLDGCKFWCLDSKRKGQCSLLPPSLDWHMGMTVGRTPAEEAASDSQATRQKQSGAPPAARCPVGTGLLILRSLNERNKLSYRLRHSHCGLCCGL